jgi:hypothetical protein
VTDAKDEFLKERKEKSVSSNGDRAQDRNRLDKFRTAFAMGVCDLTRDHLDLFFAKHLNGLTPRSRNHYRSILQVLFKRCARRDCLSRDHHLDRSEGLSPGGKTKESLPDGAIKIYTVA